MEQLCPTCAALRREWLDAIEKWLVVRRSSNDSGQEIAARLDEHRAFCKYIEWHHACKDQDELDSDTNMRNLRLRSPVNGRRGMKIEVVLTTKEAGLVVEKVVAQDKVTDQTDIKNFLTWYAARLLKGGFDLHRDDDNIFGWVAVDARGDILTIR